MKKVYVPVDESAMHYLDAYTSRSAAEDALEKYVKDLLGWQDEDEWQSCLLDGCFIMECEVIE